MVKTSRPFLMLCFVLVSFFFVLLVNDHVLWPYPDPLFHVLAEDTLDAACHSVREVMLTLLEVHEDASRAPTRNSVHFGPKFESLQASLDNLHPESPLPAKASGEFCFADTDHVDLCEVLAGKRITMIGGEHIFRLHLHLLRHQERSEKKPFPCPYHEFCTHHHVCSPHQDWENGAPPPRYLKSPTAQELVDTQSAAVNYIVSDSLLAAPNESFWAYALPFVDPMTSIRLRETFWLAAARKANVVVLARGPMSAPGSTYAGNWSLLRHVPDYVDRSRAIVASKHEDRDAELTHCSAPRPLDLLNAAVHLTVSRFLPDLFQLLQSIRQEVRPTRRKRLIWPSSWYRLPGRGAARTALLRLLVRSKCRDETFHRIRSSAKHVLASQLSVLLAADAAHAVHLEDLWTFLFNAQGEYRSVEPFGRYLALTSDQSTFKIWCSENFCPGTASCFYPSMYRGSKMAGLAGVDTGTLSMVVWMRSLNGRRLSEWSF